MAGGLPEHTQDVSVLDAPHSCLGGALRDRRICQRGRASAPSRWLVGGMPELVEDSSLRDEEAGRRGSSRFPGQVT